MSVLKGRLVSNNKSVQSTSKGPVWKGPEVDGVTQSMLSRFLVCRERFRCLVVEGLKPIEKFTPVLEFGQIWHAGEEALAKNEDWNQAIRAYTIGLSDKYMMDREAIHHWYDIATAMFPEYVRYWSQHPDVIDRKPLWQEQKFNVPYTLPSGRIVRLRGKRDKVDLVGKAKTAGVVLGENKTKSSINQEKINRQLTFDLQTMLYLITLKEEMKQNKNLSVWKGLPPIKGVLYNVIRRPAHKSVESMLKKMREDFQDNRAGEWFARWEMNITDSDMVKFQKETLDPILEQLCDWWTYIRAHDKFSDRDQFSDVWSFNKQGIHWRHPFGIYNVLDEGGASDLDEYLNSRSEIGLQRVTTLFTELE